jgi:hypothetical protein
MARSAARFPLFERHVQTAIETNILGLKTVQKEKS